MVSFYDHELDEQMEKEEEKRITKRCINEKRETNTSVTNISFPIYRQNNGDTLV